VRHLIAVAALVAIPARAGEASDGCKDLESWARSLVEHTQSSSRAASEAAFACFFTGPDDRRLDELARTTRAQVEGTMAAAPKAARCDSVKLSLKNYTASAMRTMGQYLGFAFAACSSQARDELRKLAAAGKTSEQDIQQVLSPLAARYVAAIFPE
jgi:hypothetical protein